MPSKTLHQRNKSSPALSSLAHQAGGLQLGPRRTAFGDLSNTARPLQPVTNDAAQPLKPAAQACKEKKDDNGVERTAALQRPAQRPLSVSGIKGFFSHLGSNATTNAIRPFATESQNLPSIPAANTRKPLVRKSTVVLRDPDVGLSKTQISKEQGENEAVEEVPSTVSQREASPAGAQINLEADSPSTLASHRGLVEEVEVYEDAVQHPVIMPGPIRPSSKAAEPAKDKLVRPHRPSSRIDAELSQEVQYYAEPYYEEDYTTKSRGYTTSATTVLLAPKMTAKAEREIAAAKQFVLESAESTELEEEEVWDQSMVVEYGEEIFSYMRSLEEQMRPNPLYMDHQTEVQWSMRSVLMDWLVQVHLRFALLPETLFLCVNYIDRFLSCKVVSIGKLQLVGATSIFIAAKYEEINCPSVQEIVYMVDGGYSIGEILKAESFMLSMLQFELGWPGPMSFLRRISKADDYDLETRTLAKYFLEITVMDERFIGCIPSYTAAGVHCLARLMLRKGTWSPKHVYYARYTYSQLRPLLLTMLSCCEDPFKHHPAVFEKYGDKRFKRASLFVQSEMDKGFCLPGLARAPSVAYHAVDVGESQDNWRLIVC